MGIKRPKDEPFKKQKDNRKTTERLMTHRQIKTLAFLSTLLASLQAQGQLLQTPPKLVITIAIDQLRTDYLEAFTPLYGDKGFRLLMNEGLVYTNASYSFANIDRASSIANISTGTTPYYNSIVGARWLDRETLRPVYCVEDGKYPGIQTNDKSSPQKLSTSTIGDELKVATAGKALVYSIAPFREAAVLGAGHAADGALWIDDNNGSWCSSQYYTQGGKKWMKEIDKMQSPNSFVDHLEWEPINQVSGSFSYFMSGGPQKPFKHKFTSIRKYREYKTSALVNTHITDMALKCIDGNEMGADGISDMLNLTYYAGTFDHRSITECGMELQDTYVRLDREIERLMKSVEDRVGKGKVLFVVTSTGYSDGECTQYAKYNVPVGTFYISRTANLLNMYFGALYGQGKYVDACFNTEIYLNHKFLEEKRINLAEATRLAQEFVCLMSGVRNVYSGQQLMLNVSDLTAKVRNGYHAERNGDIIIEVSPGWNIYNEDNLESQTSRLSFIPFPIILYGANVKAERVSQPVSVDRIAPTIAKSIRIRAPNACVSDALF